MGRWQALSWSRGGGGGPEAPAVDGASLERRGGTMGVGEEAVGLEKVVDLWEEGEEDSAVEGCGRLWKTVEGCGRL